MVRAFVRVRCRPRVVQRLPHQRSVVNDADRLRKYLMKFGLSREKLSA